MVLGNTLQSSACKNRCQKEFCSLSINQKKMKCCEGAAMKCIFCLDNIDQENESLEHVIPEALELLVGMVKRYTPLHRLMRRSTRRLLRLYEEKGLLKDTVPRRKPAAVQYGYLDIVEFLLDNGAQAQSGVKNSISILFAAKNTGNAKIISLIQDRIEKEFAEGWLKNRISEFLRVIDSYRIKKPGTLSDAELAKAVFALNELFSLKKQWVQKLGDDSFESKNLLKPIWPDSRLIIAETHNIPALTYSAGNAQPASIISDISKGADVNESNGVGETALILVSKTHHLGLLDKRTKEQKEQDCIRSSELLLEAGADVNAVDIAGWTALMWASFNGEKNLVKFLIDKGADIEKKSKNGETAFSIATVLGYENTAATISAAANFIVK